MKSDLIISRYKTDNVIGTKSSYDPRTFFGSKMIDIEDVINVDDSLVQYSEVFDIEDRRNNGYQYYDDFDNVEKIYLTDLSKVKDNLHTITLASQTETDLRLNTNWNMLIRWKDILIEYLYLRIKEARTFKTIKFDDVLSENINLYIRNYISNNLLNRYNFGNINFYIKYFDLDSGDEDIDPNLVFNPVYDVNIRNNENIVSNVNTTIYPDVISIDYKQTKPSQTSKFHYYFDIVINRI